MKRQKLPRKIQIGQPGQEFPEDYIKLDEIKVFT